LNGPLAGISAEPGTGFREAGGQVRPIRGTSWASVVTMIRQRAVRRFAVRSGSSARRSRSILGASGHGGRLMGGFWGAAPVVRPSASSRFRRRSSFISVPASHRTARPRGGQAGLARRRVYADLPHWVVGDGPAPGGAPSLAGLRLGLGRGRTGAGPGAGPRGQRWSGEPFMPGVRGAGPFAGLPIFRRARASQLLPTAGIVVRDATGRHYDHGRIYRSSWVLRPGLGQGVLHDQARLPGNERTSSLDKGCAGGP